MIPISEGNKGLTYKMQSSPERLKADALSREIIGAAIEVHRHLGPGLFESVYEECLCCELGLRGISFQRQVPLPLSYNLISDDFLPTSLVSRRVESPL